MKITKYETPAWVGTYKCPVCHTEFEVEGTDYDAEPGTLYYNKEHGQIGKRAIVSRAVTTEDFVIDGTIASRAVAFNVRCPGCGFVNRDVTPAREGKRQQ